MPEVIPNAAGAAALAAATTAQAGPKVEVLKGAAPAAQGQPANPEPAPDQPAVPEAAPALRKRRKNATHRVLADSLGRWGKGDEIGKADLSEHADWELLEEVGAVEPLADAAPATAPETPAK